VAKPALYVSSDWETQLEINTLPNDGVRVRVHNHTDRGFTVNLDLIDVQGLHQALGKHLREAGGGWLG